MTVDSCVSCTQTGMLLLASSFLGATKLVLAGVVEHLSIALGYCVLSGSTRLSLVLRAAFRAARDFSGSDVYDAPDALC